MPHYSIEYRKHFTNFHATVVETTSGFELGATEGCVISMIVQMAAALSATTNEHARTPIDFKSRIGFDLPFDVTYQRFISVAFTQLGIEYDGYNLYKGFREAKNKTHAALCMIPFFQCIITVFAAQ